MRDAYESYVRFCQMVGTEPTERETWERLRNESYIPTPPGTQLSKDKKVVSDSFTQPERPHKYIWMLPRKDL